MRRKTSGERPRLIQMTTTDPTRTAGLLFGWGVGGIATPIGLTGVTVMVWNIKQNRESESWPQVMGTITTSRIDRLPPAVRPAARTRRAEATRTIRSRFATPARSRDRLTRGIGCASDLTAMTGALTPRRSSGSFQKERRCPYTITPKNRGAPS